MRWSHAFPGALAVGPIGAGWRDVAVAVAVAIAATLAPYHRGLHFPFALDDYTYLMQAAGFDPVPFSLRRWLAVRGYYEGMLALFGPRPFAWHVLAFALHVGLAVAVGAWARRFGASRLAAAIAIGLFAASPLAFTVLYWIACIQELGSAVFVVAAAWCLGGSGRRPWGAVPLFVAAVLCKESVLAAPIAFALLFGRRVWPVAGVMAASGAAVFVAAGLHTRMFADDPTLPYATNYGATLLTHLATQIVWSVAAWRGYPDRIATPDTRFVLPAFAVVAALALAVVRTRGTTRRALVMAAVWYVALLLPVLPLARHAYAYYAYLPQMGFVMLLGAGIDRLGLRARLGLPLRAAAGAAVVAAVVLCAAHNARTHETLTLPQSPVPHDSVVRSGRAAGAIVESIRAARLPQSVTRVVFTSFPSSLSASAQTPGPRQAPGMVRVRRLPLRDALRDGDLVTLHFPGMTAGWADTLAVRDEDPDTAIFFVAGFDRIEQLLGPVDAYFIQAQGRLKAEDRAGARRDLRRLLALDPSNAAARTVLAGMEIEIGRRAVALELIAGIEESDLPPELQPFLREVRRTLAQPDGAAP